MSSTKAEILSNLALLPLQKLELLEKYANHLIIPEDDLLVNVNMSQMRDKAFELSTQYFPEWTDKSASDFGTFLVELFALFSEKDFWYINAFGNQTLLRKMTVYSMAFIRAVEMGYTPTMYKSASADFEMTFVAGSGYTYTPGTLEIELTDGTKFTNTSSITIPTSLGAFLLTTTLREGKYFRDTLNFNGKNIDLRNTGIEVDTIELVVAGIPYQRVPNFGDSGASSTHFIALPEEDGKLSIFFGEDGYGKTPEIGASVEVYYLSSKGEEGNLPIEDARVTKQNTLRRIENPIMQTTSTLGVNGSSLAELKNETLRFFTSRRACINEFNTTQWLLDQPEVGNAYVYSVGNIVYVLFLNAEGLLPSGPEATAITDRLTPLLSLGFTAAYLVTTLVNVSPITCTISYLTGFNEGEVVSYVKQIIQDYTDPLIDAKYGSDFNLSDLALNIRSRVSGVQNVVFDIVAGAPAVNISVSEASLLSKININDITINTIAI